MEWISWIALLQPVIMSLFMVIFRQQWLGPQLQNKNTYAIPSTDIENIQDKLKHLEENTLSGKDINGIEESISELYKSIGALREQTEKYLLHDGAKNSCDGSRTNLGIVALALIQLLTVVCLAVLWRKIMKVQVQMDSSQPLKINNNLKASAK
ncbi:uncharacterized protein LOC128550154 isoform X1 [Mercenaria mercenaria]|uniref:uncharacterized protein LOC128550154 isoform X1 n=1 Tax=Mercenaria mercenaria TaxID=6596 RepID=UPI00234F8A0B|nr:uncharacterized protein LOC128550154 isoform X1 [Mercenaria mercenaria]